MLARLRRPGLLALLLSLLAACGTPDVPPTAALTAPPTASSGAPMAYPPPTTPTPLPATPTPTPLRPNTLDIAFVIDNTESMAVVRDFVPHIMMIFQYLEQEELDYRVALVKYADFPEDTTDESATLLVDFTTSTTTFESQLQTMRNTMDWGGDSLAETVYSGMMLAIDDLSWRPDAHKVLIVIGDGAPHDPEPHTGYTQSTVIAAAQTGSITIHTMPILTDSLDNASAMTIDPFTALAHGGNGTVAMVNHNATPAFLSNGIADLQMALSAPFTYADAGGPYTIDAELTVTLDASGSRSSTLIVQYEWDVDYDGQSDIWTAAPTITYTYDAPYSGPIILEIIDGNSNRHQAMTQVNPSDR